MSDTKINISQSCPKLTLDGSLVAAQLWEANVQVPRRGLELIRPGAKCRDIAAELNDLFASLGLLKYKCRLKTNIL